MALSIAAAALRLYRLDAPSLWGDEACMLELARQDATTILTTLSEERADVDVAPPLYFLALRAFTLLVGLTAWHGRLFSVLAGVAGVLALHMMVRRFLGEVAAAFAAALMTFSALHVWYSQEARMYSLVTLLGILSTHAFLRFLETGRGAATYVALAVAALYTQYYAYLLVASHLVGGMLVLAFSGGPRTVSQALRQVTPVVLLALVLAVAVAPWLAVMARDLRHASTPGFPSHFDPVASLPFVFAKIMLFGNEAFVRDHLVLYAVLAPLAAWFLLRGILAILNPRPAVPWLLAGFTFLPMALVFAGALAGLPVYKSHPFILVSPFAYALVAHGLTRARGARGLAALGVLIAANLFVMLRLNYGDVYTKPKVREAVAFVASRVSPGDLLLKLPAKLHQAPVETGDTLVWRYYTPSSIVLRELNGRDLPDLKEKLAAHTNGRTRFFLAVAETQFVRDITPGIVREASRRFRLVDRVSFESRIRDFGLSVYLFEEPGSPGVAPRDRHEAMADRPHEPPA